MHRYANQLQIDSRGGEHRLLTLHQAISSYSNDIKGYNNHTLVSLCQLFNTGKSHCPLQEETAKQTRSDYSQVNCQVEGNFYLSDMSADTDSKQLT